MSATVVPLDREVPPAERKRTLRAAPDPETTAERLLASSAARSYDPDEFVPWDQPLEEGKWFAPPELLSLYGTDLWDRMTPNQRIELSKQEMCSIAATGIWFEVILMRMLSRHVYDQDLISQHTAYSLTEIADECRHSKMFARMIRELDVPFHSVHPRVHELGRLMDTPLFDDTIGLGGTLYVEAILDRMQRAAWRDERVQPMIRAVSEVHVVEEARHMRLAVTEVQRALEDGIAWPRLQWLKASLPLVCGMATVSLIKPSVYRATGLDPHEARAAAASNPHFQETIRWAAEPTVATFRDLGLIDRWTEPIWKHYGMV